jgi:predicted nucleic acid-binding protein
VRWAILDANVYIDVWERGHRPELLEDLRSAFVIRYSSVVLSELRRGARTPAARRVVQSLFRVATDPWAPTPADWWEAGTLIQKVGDENDWQDGKRRDFQNDALIALTARRHGATIVTSNRRDFELLAGRMSLSVLVV